MESFEEIYEEHYALIFNYCYRRVGGFDNAKDITAETFLKAYLNYSRFRGSKQNIKNWLYKIATNEIKLYYRSRSYRPVMLIDTYADYWMTLHSTTLEQEQSRIEAEEQNQKDFLKVQKSLLQLPVKYQEVITLKYFEHLRIKEISLVLGKKEGTIKSLLSRGMTKLKMVLNNL